MAYARPANSKFNEAHGLAPTAMYFVTALRTWGAGATGSRLVSGHTALHAELESALSILLRAERTLTFSSGYLANLAAITALTDEDTLLLSDAYNHASIIDACRLSRAKTTVYPNKDVAAVRRAIGENPGKRAGKSAARSGHHESLRRRLRCPRGLDRR